MCHFEKNWHLPAKKALQMPLEAKDLLSLNSIGVKLLGIRHLIVETLKKIFQLAADEAAKEKKEKPIATASENPWLKAELKKVRQKRREAHEKSRIVEEANISNDEQNFLRVIF